MAEPPIPTEPPIIFQFDVGSVDLILEGLAELQLKRSIGLYNAIKSHTEATLSAHAAAQAAPTEPQA